MTKSPSDDLSAKAAWAKECYDRSAVRLHRCMICIRDYANAFDNGEMSNEEAGSGVAYMCIAGTIAHITSQLITARTLGNKDGEAAFQLIIEQLQILQDELDCYD